MKKLYLIGGTMGVGKSTVSQQLKTKLPNSVLLDGDWCWDMNPFQVTTETKRIVIDNICHMLNNFIQCTAFENIIFCWVMHEQAIIDTILSRLHTDECETIAVSLVCSAQALEKRLQADVARGLRSGDIIQRSLARIPLYDALHTIKMDVSDRTAEQAAEALMDLQIKQP